MISGAGGGRNGLGSLDGTEGVEEIDVSAVVFNALDHIETNFDLRGLLFVFVLVV